MNRYPLLLAALIILSVGCNRHNNQPKLVFVEGDSIMIEDTKSGKTTCFTKGSNPALSPDGQWLAFTKTTGENRSVIVRNTDNGSEWGTPTGNTKQQFDASWSPDGRWLAWNQYNGSSWEIAAMPVNSRKVTIVSKKLKRNVFSPVWGKKAIICFHDLETVYLADTTGKIIRKSLIDDLPGHPVISSATVFIPVKGLDEMICNAATDDDGFDSPADALFHITMSPPRIKRLTPEGLNCGRPMIKNDGSLLFEATRADNTAPVIFLYKSGKLAELGSGREPAMCP